MPKQPISHWVLPLAFVCCCVVRAAAAESPAEKHFRETVSQIFARRCISCHNDLEKKGGLSLTTAESAFRGGTSGEVISKNDPASSYLLDLVTPQDGKAEMPKKADPLSKEELAAIRQWIVAGAPWPADLSVTDAQVSNTDWWSLKPVVKPKIPEVKPAAGQVIHNPIDNFILAKLAEKGLSQAPEADRRTLIRRLTFDLIGLPPAPEEVATFVADNDPQAYEKLVQRLLASPQYGERWARHWLDVVHYGESHGYDKDKPRLNAWPYRDYVIRSFNADKPYGRFVQEQIAGDVLFPATSDGVEALGFIASGPWDFIGHAEVPESKIDGKVARHLDRDDMVTNTINTFCSLTVNCAQCHNHKFDPITQEDYYRLQAVFAAVDRADREYDADPTIAAQRTQLAARLQELEQQAKTLAAEMQKKGGPELAELDRRLSATGKPAQPLPPEYGYHSGIEATADKAKWVQIDLRESVTLDKLAWIACYDDFNGIGAGFGFPPRYKLELSDDASFQTNVQMLVDRTAADQPNPGTTLQTAKVDGKKGRFLRFTATKLAPRKDDFICAISELQAFDAAGKNLATGATVTSLDSIEAPIRWRRTNLVDGLYPGGSEKVDVVELTRQREKLLVEKVPPELKDKSAATNAALAEAKQELAKLPAPKVVYAAMVYHGSGAFAGTGSNGGKPRPIHLLARGNVVMPGVEVKPGAIAAIPGPAEPFDLALMPNEGDRRAALARWLTDPNQPLTWRSIVNRVWLYHFGRGIVDTPNDFGRMGQVPTHPELLDWLTLEFRANGESLKHIHRLIVMSATYRQTSTPPKIAAGAADPNVVDAENRFYWRMNRRRLEAEAIRDSILAVSGKLNLQMGGPSFQDFIIDKPEHSPHYEYHRHDPEDPKSHRRSVYRFIVRSQMQPWMTTLDCADPSMLVEKRNQTITPLQALTLLNNQLTVAMAKHLAARVEKSSADPAEQIATAFQIALSRPPRDDEREALVKYSQTHGLANACRAILNLNEFVFVD